MILKPWQVLLALGLLFAPLAARAASELPLVITGGHIGQLPSGDSLKLRITGSTQCLHVDTAGVITGTGSDCGTGAGSVTTSGSPVSGNLTKFSGSTVITSGDLSGDCTTSGTLAITCTKTGGVSFAASATTDTTSASNISAGSLALARITASGSANVVLGALTATTPSYLALPSCTDSAGNHLNYTNGTGFSCGTSGATAGTVTASGSPTSGYIAKWTSGTDITKGDLSGDCTTSGTLAITCTKTGGASFTALATASATNGVSFANIAQLTADQVLGNFTGSTANIAGATLPNCAGGTNALNYSTSTHAWSCLSISAGAGTVTASGSPTSGYLATWTSGTDITKGDLSGDITTSGSLAATIGAHKVVLGDIAQSGANTMLGNWTGSTADVAANAMPSCADTGGNHLNYVSGSGVTCGTSGASAGVTSTAGQWFGDGSDGNVTCSGAINFTRDMYYNTLTLSSGCSLNTNGYRLFALAIDATSAPANSIWTLGSSSVSLNGVAATSQFGGSGGATVAGHTVNLTGSGGGTSGATGATGAGAQASAPSAPTVDVRAAIGGTGGAGGAVGGTTGGTARASVSPTATQDIRYATTNLNISTGGGTPTAIGAGTGGAGGSAGAGDGTGSGGGGGGGGGAGPLLWIACQTFTRGGSTAAGTFTVKGGAGANGDTPTVTQGGTNNGGGGGGAGGPGGWGIFIYQTLAGSAGTNEFDASAGAGGTGGNGRGTGGGGNGGGSGSKGRWDFYNMTSGAVTINDGSLSVVAGSAASGGTGGGGATNSYQVSL